MTWFVARPSGEGRLSQVVKVETEKLIFSALPAVRSLVASMGAVCRSQRIAVEPNGCKRNRSRAGALTLAALVRVRMSVLWPLVRLKRILLAVGSAAAGDGDVARRQPAAAFHVVVSSTEVTLGAPGGSTASAKARLRDSIAPVVIRGSVAAFLGGAGGVGGGGHVGLGDPGDLVLQGLAVRCRCRHRSRRSGCLRRPRAGADGGQGVGVAAGWPG